MQESQEDQKSQEDQPPSEEYIKANLQRYSPFYRQAMHFADPNVETLFYVAHDNFSSEKAVEKFKAFELFEKQKIVLVELNNAPRFRTSDVSESGPSEHQGGNSAHFTVKVKDKDSETLRELIIYGDGKCGIASLFVALNEISRGDIPLLPEVLIRDGIVLDASTSHQDGDIVQSDPGNHYDALLKKIYKPLVKRDENGHDEIGALKLHHCVKNDLEFDSDEFIIIRRSLVDKKLKEKVKNLLINTENPHWLTPKDVHEILTDNLAVLAKIREGKLKNISADNIFSFQAKIPPTVAAEDFHPPAVVAEEPLPLSPEASSAPNADNQTLTRAGRPNEGMELEPDKTLKHEFRIIVLNILHEWIEGEECDFSKIDGDKFLESLIKEKLGDGYAQKIKTELGGQITFKSLLAIDEDLSPQFASLPTLASIPEESNTNQSEQLEKEREAFYSAPCGNDKKVFEKILDIAKKFCQYLSFTKNEYSKNEEILLEDFKQVLNNFTNLSLDEAGKFKLASINSLIEKLEEEHLSDFAGGIDYQLAFPRFGHAGGAPAHANAPPAPAHAPSIIHPVTIGSSSSSATAEYAEPHKTDHQDSSFLMEIEKELDEILRVHRPDLLDPAPPARSRQSVDDCFKPIPLEGANAFSEAGNNFALPLAQTAPDEVEEDEGPIDPIFEIELDKMMNHNKAVQPPPPLRPVPSTSNLLQAKPNQDVDKFGELMETALRFIVNAFGDLGEAIKTNCKEAREDLLKKVNEMEEPTKKPGNATGKQGDKKTSETPDNNILKPIFSALRSCLGDRNKSP